MEDYGEDVYWVWLQHALGAGSSKQNRILTGYRTLRDFYQAGREAWLLEGCFTNQEMKKLSSFSASDAAALAEYCGKIGQNIVTPAHPEYPELLREIRNPPCVLYVRGELPGNGPAVAIVGTRKATATGRAAARSFAFSLASQGVLVVSGGAMGIDTAAHQGALQAGGKTVCVLGCGIDANYLMANAGLRDAVAHSGALVSEYPPGTQASGSNFPIRNRIISGLSLGTLVVEAAAKSGSLITADFALEQGRDVFAVPGGIFSPVSQGVNRLIKSGAKPVSSADEILEEYQERFPGKFHLDDMKTNVIIEDSGGSGPNTPGEPEQSGTAEARTAEPPRPRKDEPESETALSPDARAVRGCLNEAPRHISDLERLTGLPARRVLAAVTELELSGCVRSFSGRRYSLP